MTERGSTPRQEEMAFPNRWGGWRENAGRKPSPDSGVSHLTRPRLAARHPAHVTVRLVKGLPTLRQKETYEALRRAFAAGCERFGFRLCEYSVQGNHLHLITEAKDRSAMSRGMQGLLIRVAKALNKLWRRRGTVFADRYHEVILKTPRQVRHALNYVLNNARKHGVRLRKALDYFASGPWFKGCARR